MKLFSEINLCFGGRRGPSNTKINFKKSLKKIVNNLKKD